MTLELPKLPEPAETDWWGYVRTESGAARADMLEALDRFVSSFKALADIQQSDWAFIFAALHETDAAPVPVRIPLFRHALLPSLSVGVLESRPNAARLLSRFDQQLQQSPEEAALLPGGDSIHALLEQATEDDPTDTMAWRALVEQDARWLAYSLHELPNVVLAGINGASIEQCDQMLARLATFRDRLCRCGETDLYEPLLHACEFHYKAYGDYLRSGHLTSYAFYLDEHFGDSAPTW